MFIAFEFGDIFLCESLRSVLSNLMVPRGIGIQERCS